MRGFDGDGAALDEGWDRYAGDRPAGPLGGICRAVESCRACPRLVEWREEVGRVRRRAFTLERYWARPVPGFGDPGATLLILGLAPAAHGGNRTGRVFTGDRSGDWLYAALYRAGLSNREESTHASDGLRLSGVYITAAVKCAPPQNRPLPDERDLCQPFLLDEIRALPRLKAILCLGSFAWEQAFRALGALGHPPPRPRPGFSHGAVVRNSGAPVLIGSYHPSQQNTFTGKLTREMLDGVVRATLQEIGSQA